MSKLRPEKVPQAIAACKMFGEGSFADTWCARNEGNLLHNGNNQTK
ncbi:MAG: hypothetical protein ACFCUE_02745 [Candidatus Bathyarchaeia archaeon]